MFRVTPIVASVLIAVAGPAFAQSVGLLIGNQDYDALSDVSRADRLSRAVGPLEAAGVEVTALEDATAAETADALVAFGQRVPQSETLIVALAGRFLRTPTETFFMPSDGEAGPIATLPATGLPLSTVFAWLSATPGKALLLLGTDDEDAEFGPLLGSGIGPLDIPQGVTVLSGGTRDMADFLRDRIAEPGRPFVGAARQAGLTVAGYAPDTLVLLNRPAAPTPPPATQNDRLADIRDWRAADREDTAEAYRAYIAAHPDGEFVRMAEARIEALTDTPEARAERDEQALDLSRDARRQIQRDLSLLGFNTRGIDGIFGRGTRTAITDWQRGQNFAATGFLTREQVALIGEQAQRRAAELETEAEKRREQQLQQDLAYWDETGALGDEAGLRAYLKRYPDGEYAEVANERLAAIEASKRGQADRLDRQLWDEAVAQDTLQAYEDYLVSSPDGAFRDDAQARIVELQRESEFAAAAREEAAMNLSPRTKQVVEQRLDRMGLRPGKVDGVFDDDTRRAIRRYQRARNMEETGYLNESVVVQLMADTVRQIFR
jgi:peptidoglycan hydrolase-like protein with peptidoglycan-binding domain